MPAITYGDSFVVDLPPAEVRIAVLSWWRQLPHTVVADGPQTIAIRSGSQVKLRLLGGALIASSSLPMCTTVTIRAEGTQTEVSIEAADAAGFGIKTGMKGKYRQRAVEVVEGLRAALASPG